MPTTRPRYAVTDTGEVAEMLDLASRAWPDERDRKALLLRLAAEGREVVERRLETQDAGARRAAQSEALTRVRRLVDQDVLLSDEAWR